MARYDDDEWFSRLAHAEPLLTREQEGELGFQIEAGVLAQERLNGHTALNTDDIHALRLLVTEGDKARERFILANVRIARFWALRRWRTGSVGTLSLDDLTSEGMRAVVHATEMFDHTLGIKFSTYSTNWIRQHQARAVGKSLRMTFRDNDMRQLQEYLIWRDEFTTVNSIRPTLDDVRAGMGLTRRAALDLLTMVSAGYMTSLDQPLATDEDFRLADTLADAAPGPEATAMRNADHDMLVEALACLTARERSVVIARTGWDGDTPMTAEQAADTFGVPLAQVRAVTTTAMTKLRAALTGPGRNTPAQITPVLTFPASTVTCTIDLTNTRAA